MKRKRYSVELTGTAARLHALGTAVTDIARKLGIAQRSINR